VRPTAAISWSGGKDSCAAYHRARAEYDIVAAITMFTEDGARSRSHGLRPEIVAAQLDRLGLTGLSNRCTWQTYDDAFAQTLQSAAAMGVTHVIFGDILFDEHREWAERLSRSAGLTAVEPLWKKSTTDLYCEFLISGTRARIVTVRSSKLDDSFLGRDLTADLLADFIERDVDPCGERGEYHTVVTDCPAFSRPLRVRAGSRAIIGDCVAEDLILDE
jgi:diphthine-ammonia ligase